MLRILTITYLTRLVLAAPSAMDDEQHSDQAGCDGLEKSPYKEIQAIDHPIGYAPSDSSRVSNV